MSQSSSTAARGDAWGAILSTIQKRLSANQYDTWFRHLRAALPSDSEIEVRVPNRFMREWLAEHYRELIEQAAADVLKRPISVTFSTDEALQRALQAEAESHVDPTPAARQPQAAPVGIPLNDAYTFESFVVGPPNQLAHAAALAVSEKPGRTYNPFFVYGSVGLGKSHLLQAICHAFLSNGPHRKLAYLSCETFVNEFIAGIQRNELPAFRHRYRQLDVLLIDDIQFLSKAERSQEEFFHTFNDLYNGQKQIVVSSDQPPQELTGLQERLISRFKSGLVARVDAPSYEMRVAILRNKAAQRGVQVPDDVIDYIAATIQNNIRELDGAITKVLGYASLLHAPMTRETAVQALHEPAPNRPPVTIEEIMRVVGTHFGVRAADLQSKKRTRSIVIPRQICMYLARRVTMLSLEEIGGHFGGRDHSTVLHGEEKVCREVERNASFATTIEKLRRELNASSDTQRVMSTARPA